MAHPTGRLRQSGADHNADAPARTPVAQYIHDVLVTGGYRGQLDNGLGRGEEHAVAVYALNADGSVMDYEPVLSIEDYGPEGVSVIATSEGLSRGLPARADGLTPAQAVTAVKACFAPGQRGKARNPAGPGQRHAIRILWSNGDRSDTEINGTQAEIRAYYAGKQFNIGSSGRDLLVTAKRVIFLPGPGAKARNPASDVEIANLIVSQLGGHSKLRAMIGAKDFCADTKALIFKWMDGNARQGNAVKIKLEASDTYTVTFWYRRGLEVREVAKFDDIYADQLIEVFERQTGLKLSLGTLGRQAAPTPSGRYDDLRRAATAALDAYRVAWSNYSVARNAYLAHKTTANQRLCTAADQVLAAARERHEAAVAALAAAGS